MAALIGAAACSSPQVNPKTQITGAEQGENQITETREEVREIFYLSSIDATLSCETIRNPEETPYNIDFYCPPEKKDEEKVEIPSFLAEQTDEVRKIIKEALDCAFIGLPVEFTFQVPEGPHNTIRFGGRGRPNIGGRGNIGTDNNRNQKQAWVTTSNPDGLTYNVLNILQIAIHEVGHNLGLDHTPPTEPIDIMTQGKSETTWNFNMKNSESLVRYTVISPHPSEKDFHYLLNLASIPLRCKRYFTALSVNPWRGYKKQGIERKNSVAKAVVNPAY